jgi:peptidoglycan/xylan/chitin deacetylase (PgdA/CDA1 family)
LKGLGVPATVFSWPAYVDADGRPPVGPALQRFFGTTYEHELPSMSWDELREVIGAGWEVGSHTVNHPYLTQLDDAALKWELEASRERLRDELGVPCRTLAYPSGDHDARVVRATGMAGYEAACTLPVRFPPHPDRLAWPRVSIQRNDGLSTFRLKVSPATRRVRQTLLWSGLEHVRRAVGRARRGGGLLKP